MPATTKLLPLALRAFGAVFCLIYVMAIVWPSGWAWHEGSPATNDYFLMIVGVYFTLGVFLIRAANNPAANVSLIWFTIWSSVVHAGVMAYESMRTPMHGGHMLGDVPALLIAAVVLAVLVKREIPASA